jgi:hypothetical protein
MTPLDAYSPALKHILMGEEFGPLLAAPERTMYRNVWRESLTKLTRFPPSSREIAERFHNQWHVCHHFVRELVQDDDLILKVAWAWLPRYQGTDQVLYRGENIDRCEAGAVGSAWSDRLEIAEMFAAGLNAVGKGGVVLRAAVPASAIIAGPSRHSRWLGENEFTVDTRKLGRIERLSQCARRIHNLK